MINYYLLTKPGIVLGNLLTVVAGFLLASHGVMDPWLFAATLLGLALIMASACVWNNYIDRQLDAQMERTKGRALATGRVSELGAIAFATGLSLAGSLLLFLYTNMATLLAAALGFFVYVVVYSLWKRHTVYSTAIGSIAGAVPPVVGYCAVTGRIDLGVLILFAMMVLWQMPHFFAIAIYRFDDYTAAKVPVLPIIKGIWRAKVHMVLYIVAFLIATGMLTALGYTGYLYLFTMTSIGLAWLSLSLSGFVTKDDQLWAQRMFRLSLVAITAFAFITPLDVRQGEPTYLASPS